MPSSVAKPREKAADRPDEGRYSPQVLTLYSYCYIVLSIPPRNGVLLMTVSSGWGGMAGPRVLANVAGTSGGRWNVPADITIRAPEGS